MRPLRRPTRATIHYHGRTNEIGYASLTFSINGVRWEYDLPHQTADDVEYMVKHISTGKGFAWAKQRAGVASRCIDRPSAVQSTLLRHRGGIASRAKRVKVTLPNV